jgi:hypothetical protein
MLRRSAFLLVALVVLAIAANVFMLQRVVWRVSEQDPRNEGIEFVAYYRYGVLPSEIVLDLWSVSGDKSIADVSRVLLMVAGQLKEREFQRVFLAWRGDVRFAMKGSYFAELGREFGVQNPVYTLRTMPENMFLPDGRPAFETWTGGVLAVLAQQMEDLKRLHMGWYGESTFATPR